MPVFVIVASDLKYWLAVDGIKGFRNYTPFEEIVRPSSLLNGYPIACRVADNLHASFSMLSISLLPFQQYIFELNAIEANGKEGTIRAVDVLIIFGFRREAKSFLGKLALETKINKAVGLKLLDRLNIDAGLAAKAQVSFFLRAISNLTYSFPATTFSSRVRLRESKCVVRFTLS